MNVRALLGVGLFACVVGIAGLSGLHAATATAVTTDFETFAEGDLNGQDGWSSGHGSSACPLYDVAVVPNTYGYASLGARSLRISNAITCGSFNDQTFSRSLPDDAGEASADVTAYSGGTRQRYFEAQWDFASTVPGSEQPGLSVVASPDRGDAARMSWVQIIDTPTGLQVNFEEYRHSILDFVVTPVATGLDESVPHTVKLTVHFIDGPTNDVVQVSVDGVLVYAGTTWEDYYRDFEGGVTHAVDSVMFRVAGAAAPATLGQGFLIDNFSQSSSAVPQTTAVSVTGPTDATYGVTATATAAGGDGTGAYVFSTGASSGCSVSGATITVIDASGTCILVATRAADSTYAASSASVPVTVTLHKASQSAVTMSGPTDVTYGATATATAAGGDGTGAYVFSTGASTGCSVSGATIAVTNASGTCVLVATRAADGTYAVSSASVPFTAALHKASQSALTMTGPTDVTYGTTAIATAAGGSGTGAYVFSAGGSTGCSVVAIVVAVTNASGTCVLSATRAADANYIASATTAPFGVTLHKATQSAAVIVTGPASIVSGSMAIATASGGNGSGGYSLTSGASTGCTLTGATVSVTNASGTCLLTATRAEDNNYLASTSSTGFTVALNPPISVVPEPPPVATDAPSDESPTTPSLPSGIVVVPFIGAPQTVPGLAIVQAAVSATVPTVSTSSTASLMLDGTGTMSSTVTVSVPVGAVPGAASLVVRSFVSIADLTALAPLPIEQGRIITAFSPNVMDAAGHPISIEFTAPVSLAVTIPAATAPASASLSDFTLVSWSGTAWMDVPAQVAVLPDGSIQIAADVTRFPIYGVRYRAGGQPFVVVAPVFASLRLALAVFERGSVDDLEVATRNAGASGVWVQDAAGTFSLLIVDGPTFLKVGFATLFPNGLATATAVTLVQA